MLVADGKASSNEFLTTILFFTELSTSMLEVDGKTLSNRLSTTILEDVGKTLSNKLTATMLDSDGKTVSNELLTPILQVCDWSILTELLIYMLDVDNKTLSKLLSTSILDDTIEVMNVEKLSTIVFVSLGKNLSEIDGKGQFVVLSVKSLDFWLWSGVMLFEEEISIIVAASF